MMISRDLRLRHVEDARPRWRAYNCIYIYGLLGHLLPTSRPRCRIARKLAGTGVHLRPVNAPRPPYGN